MTIPYENASSGHKARDETARILQSLGCESVGFMDNFADGSVLLAFTHRGRSVQLSASAKGWATMALQKKPYTSRMRTSRAKYEERLLAQGMIAVNSILRDWVKGQVTAIECGILPFDHVFGPYMLTSDGTRVIEKIVNAKMLPAPDGD